MSWCPVLSESQDRVLCWSGWQSQASLWPLSSGIWAPSSLLVSPGGQSLHREKDSGLKGWGWQPRTWACCLMARASPVILRLPSLFPSLSSWMLMELAHWSQKITAGWNPGSIGPDPALSHCSTLLPSSLLRRDPSPASWNQGSSLTFWDVSFVSG